MWIAALIFLTLGLSDLARSHDNEWRLGNLFLCFGIGIAPLVLLTILGALPVIWLGGGVILLLAWHRATARGIIQDRFAIWPVIVLGLFVGFVLAFPSLTPALPGSLASWYSELPYWFAETTPPDRAVLLFCYAFFLVNSANLVVTAVLSLAGPRVRGGSRTIRGGRIIGPIERLFIFWMAVAGQVLALGAIIAAKGILRYPEISEGNRRGRGRDRGALAEYVLIGSLVSWSMAFLIVPIY